MQRPLGEARDGVAHDLEERQHALAGREPRRGHDVDGRALHAVGALGARDAPRVEVEAVVQHHDLAVVADDAAQGSGGQLAHGRPQHGPAGPADHAVEPGERALRAAPDAVHGEHRGQPRAHDRPQRRLGGGRQHAHVQVHDVGPVGAQDPRHVVRRARVHGVAARDARGEPVHRDVTVPLGRHAVRAGARGRRADDRDVVTGGRLLLREPRDLGLDAAEQRQVAVGQVGDAHGPHPPIPAPAGRAVAAAPALRCAFAARCSAPVATVGPVWVVRPSRDRPAPAGGLVRAVAGGS